MAYRKQLNSDPTLSVHAKQHVSKYWWAEMCVSANTAELHDCLFDQYMFDKNGMLDMDDPVFKRVVAVMKIAYVHIITKFGPETLPGWHATWVIDKEKGAVLAFQNDNMKEEFGMSTPKGGYLDLGPEEEWELVDLALITESDDELFEEAKKGC